MGVSAAGIAFKDGRFFVAKRKPGTSIGERWEFPGGKVEPGETPEEALHREYLEELSVSIHINRYCCSGSFSNKGEKYTLHSFFIDMLSEPICREHQEYRWVTAEELKDLELPSSDRIIADYLIKEFI